MMTMCILQLQVRSFYLPIFWHISAGTIMLQQMTKWDVC